MLHPLKGKGLNILNDANQLQICTPCCRVGISASTSLNLELLKVLQEAQDVHSLCTSIQYLEASCHCIYFAAL